MISSGPLAPKTAFKESTRSRMDATSELQTADATVGQLHKRFIQACCRVGSTPFGWGEQCPLMDSNDHPLSCPRELFAPIVTLDSMFWEPSQPSIILLRAA